jgi:hypothetical protein
MNRIGSLSLVLLCIVCHICAQFGPPVGWDSSIVKKDAYMKKCRQWATSFESWDDFTSMDFDITPLNDGKGSAHTLSSVQVRSGKYAHMGVITAIEDSEHIGWPSVQLYKNTYDFGGFSGGVYIEIWVWLDIAIGYNQWVTLGQISPSMGATPGTRYISLDIGDQGYLQLGNVPDPNYAFHIYQDFTNLFPRRQWVNITLYVNFDPNNGYAALWQDGVLQSVANVHGGYFRVNQLHFGLYADNLIPGGVVFNDDLTITEVTTMDKACPSSNWIMTLPPTNPPVPTNGSNNGEVPWVMIEDNAASIRAVSQGVFATVCLILLIYMLL